MSISEMLGEAKGYICKAGAMVAKEAPVIFGVAAIGFTAWGVYETVKATRKVDAHIAEFEERKENGEEITTTEFGKTMAEDTYKAVLAYLLAITCGVAGYKILNYRLIGASAVAATWMSKYNILQEGVDEKYGEGTARKFEDQYFENNVVEAVKAGVKPEKAEMVTIPSKHTGMALSDCEDFVSDDLQYMRSYIQMKDRILQEKFAKKGEFSINYIISALGGEKIREGGILGFNADNPYTGLELRPITVGIDEDGVIVREYWVDWGTPSYLYS